jgi:hypothetical protein
MNAEEFHALVSMIVITEDLLARAPWFDRVWIASQLDVMYRQLRKYTEVLTSDQQTVDVIPQGGC